ncbi:hypothetical protein BCR34DRAFT_623511 [Clohesyomyces aquaticus]|uniref:Peptidase C15, pyroglutamyl peptidase I-like protein n=1 Tax=Clohesyomyces aquaticus TaxID=1231657 RepID=A0A1Y1ZUV0_9PLEO|nr:hypothetical protein BCR34DRAFT_623511 [Clohesyomyces aquaticus]
MDDRPTKVLITGFGPFQDIISNPSWTLASALSSSLPPNTTLIIPPTPLPAAYHKILASTPQLIRTHNPDIVLHIGLANDRDYFAVETSAQKEGYHDIPDVDRKVFTRAENKKVFGKAAGELKSTLDLEAAVGIWKDRVRDFRLVGKDDNGGVYGVRGKGKGKGAAQGRLVNVRLSDDVGNFVCGFVFYLGLLEMQRSKGRGDAVFLHVPMLEGDEEIGVGVKVVQELIKALVEVWKEKKP